MCVPFLRPFTLESAKKRKLSAFLFPPSSPASKMKWKVFFSLSVVRSGGRTDGQTFFSSLSIVVHTVGVDKTAVVSAQKNPQKSVLIYDWGETRGSFLPSLHSLSRFPSPNARGEKRNAAIITIILSHSHRKRRGRIFSLAPSFPFSLFLRSESIIVGNKTFAAREGEGGTSMDLLHGKEGGEWGEGRTRGRNE